MIARGILLTLLALGAAAPLAAQRELYTVRGVVRDTDGNLIPGVEILLASPRRSVFTGPNGYFAMDSVPPGNRRLMARRIGYLALNPRVDVPQGYRDTLQIVMLPLPQQLPPVEVVTERHGIFGVVGDTGYHALPGTLVELLGGRIADTTDEHGRFAFPDLKNATYMVRFSRPGYFGRLLTVDLNKKGLDLSVMLDEYRRGPDWVNSIEANNALADLAVRLQTEFRRNRMTREELERYGTMALCDIPRLRSEFRQTSPAIIIRGTSYFRGADLCGWNADQVDLLEFGSDPCREVWGSVAQALGVFCGATRGASLGNATRPGRRPGYVVMWPRN